MNWIRAHAEWIIGTLLGALAAVGVHEQDRTGRDSGAGPAFTASQKDRNREVKAARST